MIQGGRMEKTSKMANLSLIETIEMMEEYERKGYDVYFEGRGDGYVHTIVEAFFV